MVFKFVQQKNEKTDYLIGGISDDLGRLWQKYRAKKAELDRIEERIRGLEEKKNECR